ncbi:MAG: bifunctional adenosylcobinamide kinase/adenosylcobinamide-phosphate guanylyltransferase [Hyphomicrobiaceae bacterium]
MPATDIRRTLVIGGARSGKSRHAEALVMATPPPWLYVATAEAHDGEMRARIAEHRLRRDARWETLDAPLDLAAALAGAGTGGRAVLVDCATLWLSNIMLAGRDVEAETARLVEAVSAVPGSLVVVSNEVGLGIVPETPLGRRFRDAQGRLNQRLAEVADRVVLTVAGLPLTVK